MTGARMMAIYGTRILALAVLLVCAPAWVTAATECYKSGTVGVMQPVIPGPVKFYEVAINGTQESPTKVYLYNKYGTLVRVWNANEEDGRLIDSTRYCWRGPMTFKREGTGSVRVQYELVSGCEPRNRK